MGKLVVIEGLDGSGKATQSALLAEALQNSGRLVRKVSFPNYQSPASAPVQMYLNGEFGSRPGDVNAYAASAFYAVDRYASYKTDWMEFYNGTGIVVADRYATSNAIHQCAKLPQQEWPAYTAWLEDFEYVKLGIPKPDLVVYLDVAPEVSQKLLSKRYKNDNTRKDIHERDIQYLIESRNAAMWCIKNLGWRCVTCAVQDEMRMVEDIAAEILRIVKENV